MFDTQYYCADPLGIELVVNRKAGFQYPWHVHTGHWTIGLVLSGTVSLKTPGAASLLKPGHSFIVRPCEAHSLELARESSLATLCVGVSPGPVVWPDFQGASFVGTSLPSHTLSRLQDLAGTLACSGPLPLSETPVQAVVRRLVETPEDPFSVLQMARFTGYAPRHFLRCFRKETGMSPHGFQLACRLGLARSLLRKKTAAAEAAVSSGFADQSHMHKVFRHHHGLTPRQFLHASIRLTRE